MAEEDECYTFSLMERTAMTAVYGQQQSNYSRGVLVLSRESLYIHLICWKYTNNWTSLETLFLIVFM